MNEFWCNLFLILAGFFIQVPISFFVVTEWKLYSLPIVISSFLLAILLVALGTNNFEILYKRLLIFFRRSRKGKNLKFGIFHDIPWCDNELLHTWTNISPSEWKTSLDNLFKNRKIKCTTDLINTGEILHKYDVVVNPYGGVYKETDVKNLKELDKIFQFVEQGGIYINVSDIPGYYHYFGSINRAPQSKNYGGLEEIKHKGILINRAFVVTPFLERLGMRAYFIADTLSEDRYASRYKNLESKSSNDFVLQRIFRQETNVEGVLLLQDYPDHTPWCTVTYGKGCFIFSMVSLSHEENLGFRTKFVERIVQMIEKEINE